MTNLSEAAKRALESAPGYAQGAVIDCRGPVRSELWVEGLIGEQRGLTRKGSILAEKLKSARERELFG